MLIINFYGGPGSGKSTTAAGLFYKLKKSGVNVELVNEYAKEKVWEGHINILEDQLYVFAKQLRKIRRLESKVDVTITDSPLLLSAYYSKYNKHLTPFLEQMIFAIDKTFNNFNVFIERTKPYNPNGRLGSEDSSKEKDKDIRDMLDNHQITYQVYPDNDEIISKIYEGLICLL